MGNASSSRGEKGDGLGAGLLDVVAGGGRQSSSRAGRVGDAFQGRLAASLARVDGRGSQADELVRTPSAQRDLEVGVSRAAAARAQRMRAELRQIDTEIVEASAQLRRAELLRGPSGTRYECDSNCVVGGCGEEFAEDEGVLCDCHLFLCHACFGATVVKNECQIGGRFDCDLQHNVPGAQGGSRAVTLVSEPGSLPCPLFPQDCSCGHIPLRTIQRAMLHPSNRGRDGNEEDISSPGTSPHKTHLLARRRWAEAQAGLDEGLIVQGAENDMLVRTFTEARRLSLSRSVAGLSRTTSGKRAVLADRYNELAQLKAELLAHPVAAAIPAHLRRTCAQCRGDFAAFEGGECHYFSNRVTRHSHFLCALCYGGYILRACSDGGVFETEIRNEAGVVVSAPGRLPCPFFHAIRSGSQLVPRTGTLVDTIDDAAEPEPEPEPELQPEPEPETDTLPKPQSAALSRPVSPGHESGGDADVAVQAQMCLPQMECRCGAVPMSSIETVLLDPRNTSIPFWRTRHAETLVRSLAEATITVENLAQDDELPPGWAAETDHMSNQQFFVNAQTGEFAFEQPPSIAWTREVELIGRGFTPANVYETARLRVAIAENTAVANARRELEELRLKELQPDALAVAELRMRVIDALDHGGSLQCPRCGVRAVKDDACIHMDSCECGAKWCFLCGKLQSECPRGPGRGGCDEQSYYLEQHHGWGNFALDGENAAFGAQQEFLRQRQAFMVRAVMERADPKLWESLQKKHPDLLTDTPTPGRHINWATLHEARFPLFGGNRRNENLQSDAQRRLDEHYEQLRIERERLHRELALRRRQQAFCIPSIACAIAALLVGTSLMMTYSPPPNPAIHEAGSASDNHDAGSESGSGGADVMPEPQPHSEPEPEPAPDAVCNWACHSLQWVPIIELLVGLLLLLYGTFISARGGRGRRQNLCSAQERPRFFASVAAVLIGCALNWVGLLGLVRGPEWVLSILSKRVMVWFLIPASTIAATVWLSVIVNQVIEHDAGHDLDDIGYGVLNLVVWIGTGVCIYFAVDDGTSDAHKDPTAKFHCDWKCVSLAVIPEVKFALGLLAMAVSTVAHVVQGDADRRTVAAFGAASGFGAAFCFWPASMPPMDWLTANWLVAYIVAPLFVCGFGTLWLAVQAYVAHDLVRETNSGECHPVVLVYGLVVFIFYLVAMATTRIGNKSYLVPEPDFAFSCDSACQFLLYVPIVEASIGGFAVLGRGLVAVGWGRRDDVWFDVIFSCMSAIVPFWPILYGAKSFVTGSWVVAYVLAPVSLSAAFPWVCATSLFLLEAIKGGRIESFTRAETRNRLAVAVAAISTMSAVVMFCCMVYLRHKSWEPEAAHNDVSYMCTWPCVAVRAAVFMSLGIVCFAQIVRAWTMLAHRDDAAHAQVAGQFLLLLLGLALLLLAGYASAVSWPTLDSWLAEKLVTGSWLVYVLLSGQTVVANVGTWSAMLTVFGPRARMLNQVYSLTPLLVIFSAIVSSWLLYVLRGSIAEPLEQHLSPFSLAILWESRAMSYIGITLLAWKWNYQEGAARRLTTVRAWSRIVRTVLLWLPATSWPAIVSAVAVHASSTQLFDFDLGALDCGVAGLACRHVLIIGVTGISFLIGGSGFVSELIQFDRHRGIQWQSRASAQLVSVWAVVAALVATNVYVVTRS